MAKKSYDEEDRQYARTIYCAADYQSLDKLVERMKMEVPDRYGTLQPATVLRWKRKDKKQGIDWSALRTQRQRKRAEREGAVSDVNYNDILDKMLEDMRKIQDQLSKAIQVDDKSWDFLELTRLLSAYNRSVEKALSILRGKIKEVDLGRLTLESQTFFLRKVFEDIGLIAPEIDEDFGNQWKKYVRVILARMNGIYKEKVITDALSDLCLDAIIARAMERGYDRNRSQTNPDSRPVDGVVGRIAQADN